MSCAYLDCPFCGSEGQRVESRLVGEPYDDALTKVYRIRCTCGISTPFKASSQEVWDMWHTRDGAHIEPSEAAQGLIPIPDGYAEQ